MDAHTYHYSTCYPPTGCMSTYMVRRCTEYCQMGMTYVSTWVKTVEVRIRMKCRINSLSFTGMSWISDDQMTQNTSMRHKIKVPDETAENNLIRRKTPWLTETHISNVVMMSDELSHELLFSTLYYCRYCR